MERVKERLFQILSDVIMGLSGYACLILDRSTNFLLFRYTCKCVEKLALEK